MKSSFLWIAGVSVDFYDTAIDNIVSFILQFIDESLIYSINNIYFGVIPTFITVVHYISLLVSNVSNKHDKYCK